MREKIYSGCCPALSATDLQCIDVYFQRVLTLVQLFMPATRVKTLKTWATLLILVEHWQVMTVGIKVMHCFDDKFKVSLAITRSALGFIQ